MRCGGSPRCSNCVSAALARNERHPKGVGNFLVNVIAGLIAYTYQDKKPSLNLTIEDLDSLQEAHFFSPEPLALAIIARDF